MTLNADTANGLAGIASLVTSLLLVPTVLSLRQIATKHDVRLDNHEERITQIEKPADKAKPAKRSRRRGSRGQL